MRRRATILCLTLSLLGLAAPAAVRATTTPVETSIADVRASRMTSGSTGLLGYQVTHAFSQPVSPAVSLPGARIDRAEHADAFRGFLGDYSMLATWMAPNGMVQFVPASGVYENAYYTSTMPEKDAFGDTIGVPLDAGDRFELGVVNLPNDTAMPWERQRQAAEGELEWDVATQTRRMVARKGGEEGVVDVVTFRADLVARGGDVDARERNVSAPPLTIDLPTTYPGQALGGYFYSQQWPHTHYTSGTTLRVLPSLGKAVLSSGVQGYLPEAREVTLPNGTEIKEWHVTLAGVISVSPDDNPAGLDPRMAFRSGADARAVVGDLAGNERTVPVGAGDTLVAGPGLPLGTVLDTGAGDATAADALEGGPVGSGSVSVEQELREAAQITAGTLTEPRELTFGRGAYRATLDPDFRGTGTLALRDVERGRTGTSFASAAAVPFVRVDGEMIKLTSDRLTDLRVSPFYRWVGITQTGWGSTAEQPFSFARQARTAAHKPGMAIDAVYDLGGRRYAFVSFDGFPEQDPPTISPHAIVRSLDGEAVSASPVQYLELPAGDVVYEGETHASEFAAPLDVTGDHKGLSVGIREFSGTILTPDVEGEVTVVRGGASPVGTPRAEAGASFGNGPVGVYYTPPDGIDPRFSYSAVRSVIAREPAPVANPKPLGTACGQPQVSEPTADAPPPFDIRSAWLDADDANMYVTMRIADVPASAPSGAQYSYALHWRTEHSAFYARAVLTGSTWTYAVGFNNTSAVVAAYADWATTTGEVRAGPDGLIRVAIPVAEVEGDMMRDLSVRSTVVGGPTAQTVDQAPEGGSWQFGTGGDYRFGVCA